MLDPFSKRRPHGVGMGLAISQRTVLEHGVSITAANREADGARVAIRLPAAPVALYGPGGAAPGASPS